MITLSQDQQEGINKLVSFMHSDDEMIALSGPGGTGKSFLIKHFLEQRTDDRETFLASTTNQAAAVLAEATGEEVSTVHKLFKLRIKRDYVTGKEYAVPTKNTQAISDGLIIIDEASMIDEKLLTAIKELTFKTKIIFVGDKFQLAPVKAKSCPAFEDIEVIYLSTIHRQEEGSSIIPTANAFRDALVTDIFPTIQSMPSNIELVEPAEFKAIIDEEFAGTDTDPGLRILAWTNKQVHKYNTYVRKLKGFNDAFHLGELVRTNKPIMYLKESAFHTDQMVQITRIEEGERIVDVDDEDHYIKGWEITLEHTVKVFQPINQNDIARLSKYYKSKKNWYSFYGLDDRFCDLRPLYASTIAKSQGSTFRKVFMDVDDIAGCTINSDIARLMYVGLSRASDKVYMRGNLPQRIR